MNVAKILEVRRRNWHELERLCYEYRGRGAKRLGAERISRFATLYRSVCADLALADSYQLPPNTVQYLHSLVGRAHNQLYRSRTFDLKRWGEILFTEVPRAVFGDWSVRFAFCFFWFFFLLSAWIAASPDRWPDFAEAIVGEEDIMGMEQMYAEPIGGDADDSIAGNSAGSHSVMAGFYIQHNTTIALQGFASGLFVLPGLFVSLFNSSYLGAVFGYMARSDVPEGVNFFHFVTAHGPFELTAIALSSGAGLKLGMSILATGGLSRGASLRKVGKEAMPLMGCAMCLLFLAALIEGFISPTGLPYAVKAAVAILSTGFLIFYFLVLGYPRRSSRAAE